MRMHSSVIFVTLATTAALVTAAEPGRRFDLVKRASEIDPAAREHPEIGFVFADPKTGKPADVQHAVVDTSVPSQGRLVIWLMAHNPGLFDRIASYGLHGIQVHYANRWFGLFEPEVRDAGDVLGRIRLEAATGADTSPLVTIPKADGMQERARQFLLWLDREHPEGTWAQFLTADRQDVRWDKVTMAGSSHGSTTAARFAMHQPVDRVVMFCGPRDNTETWQGGPSATPAHRFFGFSHVLDSGWAADHYCRSWQLLRMNECGPVVNVDEAASPYGDTRRLITACDVGGNAGRAHSCVTPGGGGCKDTAGRFIHEPVWRYVFLHPVAKTGAAVPLDADCAMERQGRHGVPPEGQARSVADLVDGPSAVREVAAGFTFTEGPAADSRGDVFFTDIPQERIHVWRAATGGIETWLERTGRINGLFFRADGTLVGCQMGTGRGIMQIDPATKAIAPLAERLDGKRFNAPNDLVIDATGGVWFTDPAYGRKPEELELDEEAVYWVSADGATVRKVAGGFKRPNGIALSPDGGTLYVADRDADVTVAFPVEGPGRLGPRRPFADTGSDGFAVDEQGNLYVTPKAPAIRVFSPTGRNLGDIPLPLPASNVTFGGPDRRTLFITARDKIFTLPMKVQGGQ
jgi:sugar lactone lactonase YvrE